MKENTISMGGNLFVLRTLIAKDFRTFRMPTVALSVLGVATYGFIALVVGSSSWPPKSLLEWLFQLGTMPIAASLFSALLLAAFGGMALAGERADRTAVFMAMLPVTRRQIVASKLVATSTVFLVAILLHLSVCLAVFGCVSFMQSRFGVYDHALRNSGLATHLSLLPMVIGLATCFFGIAWFVGSLTSIVAISACISIAVTLSVNFLLIEYLSSFEGATKHYFDNRPERGVTFLSLLIGITFLIAGSVTFSKRTEP